MTKREAKDRIFKKLNAFQRMFLENAIAEKLNAVLSKDAEGAEYERGIIYGYMSCLYDMGIVTKEEFVAYFCN